MDLSEIQVSLQLLLESLVTEVENLRREISEINLQVRDCTRMVSAMYDEVLVKINRVEACVDTSHKWGCGKSERSPSNSTSM